MATARNDGGPAFPREDYQAIDAPGQRGMTLRDYFASKAPEASAGWIDMRRNSDRMRNPHNDSYKPPLRSETELRAAWAFEWADAMLKAREA